MDGHSTSAPRRRSSQLGGRAGVNGNRSVSSRSGSADVLQAARRRWTAMICPALFKRRTCFVFRPSPDEKCCGGPPCIGVLTIFNAWDCSQPAGAKRQPLGVGRLELLDPLSRNCRLGMANAFVLCSADGLDEVNCRRAGTASVRQQVRSSDGGQFQLENVRSRNFAQH